MKTKVIQGNNIDILKVYPDNHFDSIVTDPPYGIEFLHKDWDKNTGAIETWEQCFRVLKPGGYILAFSAARTYHNLATNIESVGFEIRDQLMWLYASGFPKAQDVGKNIAKKQQNKKNMSLPQAEWDNLTLIEGTGSTGSIYRHSNGKKYRQLRNTKSQRVAQQYGGGEWKDTYEEIIEHNNEWSGWKTALKPAHEPIVMARKPFKGSSVDNVLKWGVGALNIDATRIEYECDYDAKHQSDISRGQQNAKNGTNFFGSGKSVSDDKGQGRFPSNVLGEVEGYQKFFYCPKVSRAERHIGFEAPEPEPFNNPEDMKKHPLWDPSIGTNSHRFMKKIREHNKIANNHPTVKPVALMRYLIKLVTPQGGKVLDPFTGSGSTGMAAVELDYDFTGCELDPDYVNIAETRITAWKNKTDLQNNPLPDQWFEEE